MGFSSLAVMANSLLLQFESGRGSAALLASSQMQQRQKQRAQRGAAQQSPDGGRENGAQPVLAPVAQK